MEWWSGGVVRFGVLSWKKGTRRAGWVARGSELGARAGTRGAGVPRTGWVAHGAELGAARVGGPRDQIGGARMRGGGADGHRGPSAGPSRPDTQSAGARHRERPGPGIESAGPRHKRAAGKNGARHKPNSKLHKKILTQLSHPCSNKCRLKYNLTFQRPRICMTCFYDELYLD